MRLLPVEESGAILDAVCEELVSGRWGFDVGAGAGGIGGSNGMGKSKGKGKGNGKGRCSENVRIISGEEEGMWGWVAVNYLMDGFGYTPTTTLDDTAGPSRSGSGTGAAELLPLQPLESDRAGLSSSIPPTLVDPSQRSPTFGFLDMGGASTQIAFAPTLSEIAGSNFPTDGLRSVSLKLLSGEVVEWPLFVASWLGFGTNRVRERYVEARAAEWRAELEERTRAGTEADAPTLSAGGARKGLFDPVHDPCLPKDLLLPSSSSSIPSFRGTGSFRQCLADLQPLLQADLPCPAPHTHCLFAGLPTPHIDFEREDQRGFIGISEYWYTAQQVLGVGGLWDWGEWEKGMSNFCSREWSDIEGEFAKDSKWRGSAIELSRLEMQCFKGAWISNVLHEGIGIPRMYDKGGNETLTGGALGETNEEAERRAKQKGLMSGSHQHPTHFQSLDHVGETAISWTLGKMVIEASKGISSHGYQDQPVGTSRTWSGAWSAKFDRYRDAFGMNGFGRTIGMAALPGGPYFLLVPVLVLVSVLYFAFRRRLRQATSASQRRRKASDADLLNKPNGTALDNGHDDWQAGSGMSSRSKAFGLGRLRVLGYRWTVFARRLVGTGGGGDQRIQQRRASSAPAGLNLHTMPPTPVWTSAINVSTPSSPMPDGSFFIPAQTYFENPASDQETPRAGEFLDASEGTFSNRYGKVGLVHKSSMNSLRSKRNSPQPLSPAHSSHATLGGWNDPPMTAFSYGDAPQSPSPLPESFGASSVLAPHTGEATMSRNPSGIGLADYARGLSSRPLSRTSMHTDSDE